MTNTTSAPATCTTINGTYGCQRPAGHTGRHTGTIRAGASRGIRYSFADKYSAVTRTAPATR